MGQVTRLTSKFSAIVCATIFAMALAAWASLRRQIAAVEAEKSALEAQSKGVADRIANLQASYDGLVPKLVEANAALEAFAPLISPEAFEQAQAMLSRGDVLG